MNRTRHVFLYSAWVPPALWVATLLYVRRFEGWGAWAAAPLLLPSFALSLVWACAGLLLLVRTGVQNRRPDYAVLAATLVSGAAALYYVGRALLLSIG